MAAGNTYESIATQTLASAVSSVTFSSIAGTYTDLVMVFTGTVSVAGSVYLRVNADSGTNYSTTLISGDGTTAVSLGDSTTTRYWAGYIDTTQSNLTVNLMNYSNATTYKTILTRPSIPTAAVGARVGLWRNTNAITSIVALPQTGNFAVGSTFSLYGIKAA
jgi:hypothetical protein